MDTEWLESPRLLLRLAIRRALSGCAVLAVIALLAGVLCLAVYAVIHSAIFRVAAIVAALALIFLTDFIDLAVLVYGASFGAFDMFRDFMRESWALVMLSLPWTRRRIFNVLSGEYILLLRRFDRRHDSGLPNLLANKLTYDRTPLSDSPLSVLGFANDMGHLPKLLSLITAPIVTFLNPRQVSWLPRRLVLIPARDDAWQEAVAACASRAAGVLFLMAGVTRGVEIEFGLIADVDPKKVLIILDVALADFYPDVGPELRIRRASVEAEMAGELMQQWESKCPSELRSRTVPLGADIKPIFLEWLQECCKQPQE